MSAIRPAAAPSAPSKLDERVVLDLHHRGLTLLLTCPVEHGCPAPVKTPYDTLARRHMAGWQQRAPLTEEELLTQVRAAPPGCGISTRLDGLVAIDLDAGGGLDRRRVWEALKALAPDGQTWPSTWLYWTGGRGARALYRLPDGAQAPGKWETWLVELGGTWRQAPRAEAGGRPHVHVEVLSGAGHHAVLPPSPHPSGGAYRWLPGRSPADLEMAEIPAWLLGLLQEPRRPVQTPADRHQAAQAPETAGATMDRGLVEAVAALVAPAWRPGARHDLALALAGALGKAGWPLEAARATVLEAARRAGDGEVDNRLAAVDATYRTLGAGGEVAGWSRLAALLPEEVATRLRALVRAAEPEEPPPEPPAPPVPEAPGFPLEVLPPPLAGWAEATAAALAAPVDFVGASMLAVAAAALGAGLEVEITPGWQEAVRLWVGLVGNPGSGKSPTLNRVAAPLWAVHERLLGREREAKEAYEAALLAHEAERRRWLKTAARVGKEAAGEPPALPPAPPKLRAVVSDVTREALGEVLAANSRGVLVVADELGGWLRDLTRYEDAGGRQFWLSLWSGTAIQVDRKTAASIYVRRPFAAVLGGIQPAVLPALLGGLAEDDGLVSRFLLTFPAPPPVETFPPAPPLDPWAQVVDVLAQTPAPGPDGPRVVPLAPDAAQEFSRLRRWALEEARRLADDPLAAVASKLPGQMARLALVLEALHLAAAGHPPAAMPAVTLRAVLAAGLLVRYFLGHARRVLARMAATREDKRAEAVLRWLQEHGGTCRARDLYTYGVAGIKKASEAEAALRDLADRGYGTLERAGKGFLFTLHRSSQSQGNSHPIAG